MIETNTTCAVEKIINGLISEDEDGKYYHPDLETFLNTLVGDAVRNWREMRNYQGQFNGRRWVIKFSIEETKITL